MRLALFGILLTGAVVFYFMVLLSSKSSYQEWEANELLLRPSVTSLPLGDVQVGRAASTTRSIQAPIDGRMGWNMRVATGTMR